MKRVKTGVVGCGFPFYFHTYDAESSSVIEYTAVYDIDLEKARDIAESFGGGMTAYPTLEEMLASDIDAVLVSVPHYLHEEIVERCAGAGKHVLCEKPMATTLEGCRRMIEAARRNKVKLMIAENHCFLPAHSWIRGAIAEGLIGEVNLVRAYEGVNEIEGLSRQGFWKGDLRMAGGGAFMDMAVHKFAALEYILGDRVDSVTTLLRKQVTDLPEKGEDNALSIATFQNGAIAEVAVSFTQVTPATNSLEIYGTKGTIMECHDDESPVRIFSTSEQAGEEMQQEWYSPEIEHGAFPFYYFISGRREDDHFARCILEDREPDFSPEDAMSAVECVLTGYLSFLERRPVRRGELLELARTAGTRGILERLEGSIPARRK
ncbi:MAG: Gfo/Idh/MocA family oxidoreductase [Oscillospiraceae bacterium]|nr:Gfo/Idh/MocA family oxidoreductase [Oscillospiraceae bacterium]